MRFGDVAAAAIRFAGEGFAMYPLMAEMIANNQAGYARWPSSAAIYLPGAARRRPLHSVGSGADAALHG
jgi:gamma-glutamyltranspeptidase/glutathione hydrolase